MRPLTRLREFELEPTGRAKGANFFLNKSRSKVTVLSPVHSDLGHTVNPILFCELVEKGPTDQRYQIHN